MKLRALLFGALVAAHEYGLAQSTAPTFQLRWGVKVPMRDGVQLNATIYEPAKLTKPAPVIFTLTPYVGDSYHARATYFASKGFVYALVDVRGRGNSGGAFEPFVNEGKDGYDLVEWFAKQPFCNGKVAMWGGSYAGFDQWSTLKELPPHLSTIVPAAAVHPGADFPNTNGLLSTYLVQWLNFTGGVTANNQLFGDDYWGQKSFEFYKMGIAAENFDGFAGFPSAVFQKWISLAPQNDYYDAMVPTPDQFRQMTAPILTITGHYDGDQVGALTFYRDHMRYGSKGASDKHYLIIGPWDHAGTRTPAKEVGGLNFGDASMIDMNALHEEWYRWTMLGGAKPKFLEKRVACFVAGANKWVYADTLEGLTQSISTFYLQSDASRAKDIFHSGSLATTQPTASEPDEWAYDPKDMRYPSVLQASSVPSYLTDQTAVMALDGNGLVYHSAPFEKDTDLTGFTSATLWLQMDVPDTAVEADLFQIQPDGSSVLLTSDVLQMRYRESHRTEKFVEANLPFKIELNSFPFFSRKVTKGSRLRLVVLCPDSPGYLHVMNSDLLIAKATFKDAKTAHIKLLHDAKHPSSLQVSVGK